MTVEVSVNNKVDAFLDPLLRIISTSSVQTNCQAHRFHYFMISKAKKRFARIDVLTGLAAEVPPEQEYELYETFNSSTLMDLDITIFKAWHLKGRNFTELMMFPQLFP